MRRSLVASTLAVAFAACADASPTLPDGGGGAPDGGAPDGGGPLDAGTPTGPQVAQRELLGAYASAPVRCVLPGRTRALTLIGTQGVVVNPLAFDRPAEPPENWVDAGLLALEDTTGLVRVYGTADGLPEFQFRDGAGTVLGKGPVPIFDLAWIQPDSSFVAAGWTHVVRGEVGPGALLTFRSATVRRPGAAKDATIPRVGALGDEVYAGTSQGLVVLDAATLAVRRWIDLGEGRAADGVFAVATGDFDGPMAAAIVGPTDAFFGTGVALVRPNASAAAVLVPADGAQPTALLGMTGTFLVGVRTAEGRGGLLSVVPLAAEPRLATAVDAATLAAGGEGALIPRRMAYDGVHQRLLVGGMLTGGRAGPGLLQVPMGAGGVVRGPPVRALKAADPLRALVPEQYQALAVDAQGRWYAAGEYACNEVHVGQRALLRFEQTPAGEVRLARPVLSGVRAIATDPVEGLTWLGLRDENPGVSCEGAAVTQTFCRLRNDGSCQVYPVVATTGESAISVAPGVADLDFGEAAKQRLALATQRDATFVRAGADARVLETQHDPKVSLAMTSVAWGPGDALWIGSHMVWSTVPEGLDEDTVNDRGPHGLGLLELDESGKPVFSRRYVRALPDTGGPAVAGLASNTVWDVLPLSGSRRALAALGIERDDRTLDHVWAEPNRRGMRGGLALVDDATVTMLPAPADVVFGDVTRLARAPDGTVLALDAELGVFAVDVAAATVSLRRAATWTAPARGLALAVDASGRIAVGTTRGLVIWGADGRATTVADDGRWGWVWTVRSLSDGVLEAGTDRGLVRLALDGAELPARGPSGLIPRGVWDLESPCKGQTGCPCLDDQGCATELACFDSGGERICLSKNPCVREPGSLGCSCRLDGDCAPGLTCQSVGPMVYQCK